MASRVKSATLLSASQNHLSFFPLFFFNPTLKQEFAKVLIFVFLPTRWSDPAPITASICGWEGHVRVGLPE